MTLVIAAYLFMSGLAFWLYWLDKQRATRGQWRIPERTLHAVEIVGGWPGAWLAQRVFRHKWKKTGYMIVFWTIVGVHMVGWAWWSGAFTWANR